MSPEDSLMQVIFDGAALALLVLIFMTGVFAIFRFVWRVLG